MTVAELGRRMSSAEFTGWLEYAALEPFGPLREDLRAGQLASLVANIAGSKDATPATFFPELAEPEPEPEPEDLLTQIRAWIARSKRPRQAVIRKPRKPS
jgi:hypothetical protein